LKAASTSSSLMRFAGSPRSPRFCSSVPSPIIPRWIIGRVSLASFGSGLSVIGKSFGLAVLGYALATLGDHPTRPQRRASESESTQAIALGSARCDPQLPLLNVATGMRRSRSSAIAMDPSSPPADREGLDRRRPIRRRGKFGGRGAFGRNAQTAAVPRRSTERVEPIQTSFEYCLGRPPLGSIAPQQIITRVPGVFCAMPHDARRGAP
jgi:hypothetical protein